MRAVPLAVLCAASSIVLPACDDAPPITPLPVAWMEWSDSVTAGVPFGVRVLGFTPADRRFLRIRVRVERDTVTIEPFSLRPCAEPCQIGLVYDTLVWVPGIAATTPSTVVLGAPSNWGVTGTPWPSRTFGAFVVNPDTVVAPLMRSVGTGSGFQDSFGCYVVASFPTRLYVAADQTPDWAPGFTGFVYGRVDPVLGSTCLVDAPVIYVDSIK